MTQAVITVNGVAGSNTDLPINTSVALNNQGNGGELTYAWTIVDQPAGTAVSLTGAATQTPSFVPTKEGSYLLRLVVNSGLGDQDTDQVVVAVRQLKSGLRIPAASETTETSLTRGWAVDENVNLQRLDALVGDAGLLVAYASEALARGQVVRITGRQTIKSGLPGSEVVPSVALAVADTEAHAQGKLYLVESKVGGTTTASLGDLVVLREAGIFLGRTLVAVAGNLVYLHASTPGALTTTPPTYARVVGRVVYESGGACDIDTGADVAGLAGNFVTLDTVQTVTAAKTWSAAATFSAAVIAAAIGPTSLQQHTLPAVTSDTIALLAATQTLAAKTLTSPKVTVGSDAVGDLHYVSNVNGALSRLAVGGAGTVLVGGGAAPAYASLATAGIAASALTVTGTAPVAVNGDHAAHTLTSNLTLSSIAAASGVAGHVTTAAQVMGAGQKNFPAAIGVGTTTTHVDTNGILLADGARLLAENGVAQLAIAYSDGGQIVFGDYSSVDTSLRGSTVLVYAANGYVDVASADSYVSLSANDATDAMTLSIGTNGYLTHYDSTFGEVIESAKSGLNVYGDAGATHKLWINGTTRLQVESGGRVHASAGFITTADVFFKSYEGDGVTPVDILGYSTGYGSIVVGSGSYGTHLWAGGAFTIIPDKTANLARQIYLTSGAFTPFYNAAASSPYDYTYRGVDVEGTNVTGGKAILVGGRSTGNATPTEVLIRGTVAGASSGTVQTQYTVAAFHTSYTKLYTGAAVLGMSLWGTTGNVNVGSTDSDPGFKIRAQGSIACTTLEGDTEERAPHLVELLTNKSGSTITAGQAVYKGSDGVSPAKADALATSLVYAIALDDVANNAVGRFARVLGGFGTAPIPNAAQDGSAWTEGARVWLSATTAGKMTTAEPLPHEYYDPIGVCTNTPAGGTAYLAIGYHALNSGRVTPVTQVWKSGNYTTTQTGAALWTPASGKKIAITSIVPTTYGTTGARIIFWFGASGDTTYSEGTDQPVVKLSSVPSSTIKPGMALPLSYPIYCNTADYILRVTTDAGVSLDVVVYGYEYS